MLRRRIVRPGPLVKSVPASAFIPVVLGGTGGILSILCLISQRKRTGSQARSCFGLHPGHARRAGRTVKNRELTAYRSPLTALRGETPPSRSAVRQTLRRDSSAEPQNDKGLGMGSREGKSTKAVVRTQKSGIGNRVIGAIGRGEIPRRFAPRNNKSMRGVGMTKACREWVVGNRAVGCRLLAPCENRVHAL